MAHARKVASVTNGADALVALQGTLGQKTLLFVGEGRAGADVPAIVMDHVAIDRVTGFAVNEHLFSTQALQSPAFTSRLVVRWHDNDPVHGPVHRRAVALLLFVLRDAQQSALWLGSRTTRGYGHIKTVDIVAATVSIANSQGRNTEACPGSPVPLAAVGLNLPGVLDSWTQHIGGKQ